MRNIIDAICTIVTHSYDITNNSTYSRNRANSAGESLEEYIKDIFANTIDIKDVNIRECKLSETFSYLGNKNNPPDSMLKDGGVAIEVKKIESSDSMLALNSSYPKAKLYSDSPMISNGCRNCEEWNIRDMLYCVGVVNNAKLKSLAMVYGEDYCADKETYERVRNIIKDGVESIPNVEFAETKELGRVNRVDPLGITYLRVRGMWGIENPFHLFKEQYQIDNNAEFNMMVIINKEQFGQLQNINLLYELERNNNYLKINEIKIKNPNNPAQLRDAILVTYKVMNS